MNRMRCAMLMAMLLLLVGMTAACAPPAPAPGAGEQKSGEAAAPTEAAGGAAATGAMTETTGGMTGTTGAANLANIGTADNPLVMTFVPSGDTDKIVASADQIRDMLQKETGLTIKTNVATSYAAVIEALGAGNAQVAWLPTLSYIIAHQKFGVDPILIVGRFGTTTYASQVITRKDSGIKTLKDLTGKSFCRPDPLSTSGWVIPKVMLKAVGIEEAQLGKIIDSGGHGGVVTAVYNKDCDAGATFVDARGQDKEHKDVKDVVVVIDTSKAIPNDNVSVAKGLPADVVAKLKDGLVKLTTTEEGKAALKTAYSVETLEKVADSDYDEFRVTLEAAGMDPLSLMPQPK